MTLGSVETPGGQVAERRESRLQRETGTWLTEAAASVAPPELGRIITRPALGALHHEYEWVPPYGEETDGAPALHNQRTLSVG
jgi:hypothetical protein